MYKKYLAILIAAVIVVVGIIRINIYNTIALSPIGNTDDNFKMVSNEFGEDFSEFIKDKSPVKIYLGEENDNEARVNIYGKNINLTKENPFLVAIKPLYNFVENTFVTIVDKFNKKNQNINETENNNSNDENNSETLDTNNELQLDNIVDEFINSQNGQGSNEE